jgi:hypothetical protein
MSIIESSLSIYYGILKKRPVFTLTVTIVYAVVLATFIVITEQEKNKVPDDKFREMVATEIVKSIDPEQPIELSSERVKVIFSSYNRKSKGVLTEYGLVALIEDAYALNVNVSESKEKLNTLLKLLEKQKEKDPYFGLRFEQEVIIKNLEKELSNNNGLNSDLGFVEQMKEVVRRQNNEIEELKKNNSLGIPVGIAGLIATIIFGLFSLIYPLVSRKKS